jgi:hypothetical protein
MTANGAAITESCRLLVVIDGEDSGTLLIRHRHKMDGLWMARGISVVLGESMTICSKSRGGLFDLF